MLQTWLFHFFPVSESSSLNGKVVKKVVNKGSKNVVINVVKNVVINVVKKT